MILVKQSPISLVLLLVGIGQILADLQFDTSNPNIISVKLNESTNENCDEIIENLQSGDPIINKLSACGVIEEEETEIIPVITTTESQIYKQMKRDVVDTNKIINIDVSKDNIIELLVVVTTSFAKKKGKELEPYILDSVAMASRLYRHPSMKESIIIEIVKIIRIDRDYEIQNELDNWSNINMSVVLDRFCNWVRQNKTSWNFKFDSAMLINDGNAIAGVLGITNLGRMCGYNNCFALVDKGFATGDTIAHELGHQMGAYHDFVGQSVCKKFESSEETNTMTNTVMKKDYSFQKYPLVWSNCSLYSISSFLGEKKSSCLTDQNKSPNPYSHFDMVLTLRKFYHRQVYDLNEQCSLALGRPATNCNQNHEIRKCSLLHCQPIGNDYCSRSHAIMVDGTECDTNKHCIEGECVDKNIQIVPRHGAWSKFSPWSKCSKPCGVGTQSSRRECNHPKPSMGGLYCVGVRERLRYCNIQDCSKSSDNRENVCQKNNLVLNESPDFPCADICKSTEGVVYHGIMFPDGSSCNRRLSGVCHRGNCLVAECGLISGFKKCSQRSGYFDGFKSSRDSKIIATIPPKAFNLFITKNSSRYTPFSAKFYDDTSIILLINNQGHIPVGKTVLNYGDYQILFSGTKQRMETIEVKGRLDRSSKIAIRVNPQNEYSYHAIINYDYYVVE